VSVALAAYRAVTAALEPLAPRLLAARARAGKEDSVRLGERLGHAGAPRPAGRLVWLHGASVGEGLSLLPLVEALAAAPDAPALLVTSGTRTSAELLGRRLPPAAIHQYVPVDGPRAAARFLDHWRPDLAVFAESELWPNLILGARQQGARTALVSARLSASSLKGWARAPGAARILLGGFDRVLAQDDETAARLARLGARDDGRLNLKLAGEPLPADPAALADARAAIGERPVLLVASTHPGEEALPLDVFAFLKDRPERPLLVIVPRHPVRGAAIEAQARADGFATARRSARLAPSGAVEVYVADTLGELGLWFRLARLAVMGGSLVERIGGHNPLEPARLGCPVASGPHIDNWRGVYDDLQAERAVRRVEGPATLAAVMAEALADPTELRTEAVRAAAFAARQSGVVAAAATQLQALL
jgi:3-deoxy-D-manno-octulosonic-acid transferase